MLSGVHFKIGLAGSCAVCHRLGIDSWSVLPSRALEFSLPSAQGCWQDSVSCACPIEASSSLTGSHLESGPDLLPSRSHRFCHIATDFFKVTRRLERPVPF